MREEWDNRDNNFDCHWTIIVSCVGTNYLAFCNDNNALVLNLQKGYCNVQGVWHTPNMLATMVHGQVSIW